MYLTWSEAHSAIISNPIESETQRNPFGNGGKSYGCTKDQFAIKNEVSFLAPGRY
jgi:hypothetical protein